MRKRIAFVPVLFVATALACSSSKPKAVAPAPAIGDAGIDDGGEAGDAGGLATAPDAGPAATGPTFFTSDPDAGAPAPPAVGEQALDAAIDLAITTASPKVAPKMTREGQPGRATLKEGEHFVMVVNLMPNRCYTFVGFSPPGAVSKLDLKLYGLPLNVEAGRSGAGDKAMPVMGRGKDAICPILPVAVPYKIDAVATKGAGRVGVHVFARDR